MLIGKALWRVPAHNTKQESMLTAASTQNEQTNLKLPMRENTTTTLLLRAIVNTVARSAPIVEKIPLKHAQYRDLGGA